MALLTAILVINPNYNWYMWVEVALNVVTALLTIIYQFVGVKIGWKENKLVKIAKVKLDFDFKPEDLIEEYKVALNAIDKKYHFGAKDREKFEKEKEELLQDTVFALLYNAHVVNLAVALPINQAPIPREKTRKKQ